MKQGEIVFRFLAPANENAAVAIKPAVSAFHHPASGLGSSFTFEFLGFFSAGANVGGESELLD